MEIAKKSTAITVMLTAHALSPENAIRSFKEGASSYIPKEEMANITIYLNDLLEAQEMGKHFWWRWLNRFESYFERKFGPDWQNNEKGFWDNFLKYI